MARLKVERAVLVYQGGHNAEWSADLNSAPFSDKFWPVGNVEVE